MKHVKYLIVGLLFIAAILAVPYGLFSLSMILFNNTVTLPCLLILGGTIGYAAYEFGRIMIG